LLEEFDLDRDTAAAGMLARLTQDRLLTMGDGTVEVAHEALLREWPRLQSWLEEDAQGRQLRQHLTQASRQWQSRGQETSELYRGARLSAALDWSADHAEDLNELEREFLGAGRQASEREAERQRQTNRRLRGLLFGVAVFLIVALLAGGLALIQRGHARTAAARAQRQAQVATARELTSESLANLSVDPDRSIWLALRAVDIDRSLSRNVPREAVEALHRAVENTRLVHTLADPATGNVAFSPDGKLLATGGFARPSAPNDSQRGGRAIVWSAVTGKKLESLPGQRERVEDIQFSPDGSQVLTTEGSGANGFAIDWWNARTGAKLRTLRLPGQPVVAIASPDGSRLAVTSLDGTLTIWDLNRGRRLRTITNQGPLCGLSWSPDGSKVAAAACFAGDTANVWNVQTGKQVLAVGGFGSVIDVAYSPDGKRLVTGGIDGVARVWTARTGRLVSTLVGHTGWIYDVRFSPDGREVATGSSDGTARLWDAATGRQLLVLAGHTERVNSLSFSPDGKLLATGSDDGTARIWDVTTEGGRDALTLAAGPGRVLDVAYSPDGTRLVTGGDDHVVRLWDASTGRRLRSLRLGPRDDINDIHFSPDGTRILFSGDGTPFVTDASLSKVLLRLRVRTNFNFFPGNAWSPDGRLIALGDADGRATLWDAHTGKLLRTFVHSIDNTSGGSVVYRVAFSPDGKRLATADWNDTVKVWDVGSGRLLQTMWGHTQQVNAVEFSPDGRRLLTAASDGTAKIWSLPSGHLVTTLLGHAGAIWDAEFSPSGKLVATTGDDTTVRLWNASSGREILRLTGHTFVVFDVDFSPDGSRLATASGDGTARVYLLRLGELMRLARQRVTRPLSSAECRVYLHVATCPARI
jgi:WD40 repeat protein